jgi:RimJ/RimL family protein N-acetyltransferase
MNKLTQNQLSVLRDWFKSDQPGAMIGAHVAQTGNGAAWADRFPSPKTIIIKTGENFALIGTSSGLSVQVLQELVNGFVEMADPFLPQFQQAFPDFKKWDRVVYLLEGMPRKMKDLDGSIRPLGIEDAEQLEEWSKPIPWVYETWGTPLALIKSGFTSGAFIDGQLVSLAYAFLVGATCDEVGIVTHPEYRGQGHGTACAQRLCEDLCRRGHRVLWTTGSKSIASIRIAQKLGFQFQKNAALYLTEGELPE